MKATLVQVEELILDTDRQTIVKRGMTYYLPRSQYRFLYYLMQNYGRPVSMKTRFHVERPTPHTGPLVLTAVP